MTTLSTHVLDTASGRPAAGMALRLMQGDSLLFEGVTDAGGRCSALNRELPLGAYRLVFAVADYFRSSGVALPDPPFLDQVGVDFGLSEPDGHYHVPLLVSPFAYSTYRGS
jgi:5-hydroxyisourate hydrolase